ncbi:MAG: peptidoglycan editing factor PgeF [Lachnospiraceae bacterium]|nr:peptidoglycan editing factor PgeF [Lachnospiraceae bacterium]
MEAVKREKNGVVYYTFPILEQAGIVHGFSTRLGGVSEGDCATMNLSFTRGDDPEAVQENHRRFAGAVGYDVEKLVFSNQVHETVIRRVDASDCGKGIFRESDLIGVDGLMTEDEEVVLMTFFADCVPLFFYDRRRRAIAAVHSGWRGTVRRIGGLAVEAMGREFGSQPEDILSVVGPSICQDCYEVSGDVAEAFREEFTPEQCRELLLEKPEDKYMLNLWRANEIILQEAGIPASQIQVSGLCTCCHPELLFSHRASHGRRGNLAGVITLGGKMEK